MPILYKAWLLLAVALSGVNAGKKEAQKESSVVYSMCNTSICNGNLMYCSAYLDVKREFTEKRDKLQNQKNNIDQEINRLNRNLETMADAASKARERGHIPCKK